MYGTLIHVLNEFLITAEQQGPPGSFATQPEVEVAELFGSWGIVNSLTMHGRGQKPSSVALRYVEGLGCISMAAPGYELLDAILEKFFEYHLLEYTPVANSCLLRALN